MDHITHVRVRPCESLTSTKDEFQIKMLLCTCLYTKRQYFPILSEVRENRKRVVWPVVLITNWPHMDKEIVQKGEHRENSLTKHMSIVSNAIYDYHPLAFL